MDTYWLPVTGLIFVVALFVIPFVYSKAGLGNNTQAMGLPEGTVRAFIALTLIVLFAILPIYLFNRIADSGHMLVPISGLNDDAKTKAAKDYSDFSPIFVPNPAKDPKDPVTYTMYLRQPADASGVDFAKQMLVLLGTLATSVASFYFGSKTATSAAASAGAAATKTAANATAAAQGGGPGAKPVLTGLNSNPVITRTPDPAGGDAVKFTLDLLGLNLNDVKQVRIESGGEKFTASATSSDTEVKCDFSFTTKVAAGLDWTAIAIDDVPRESDPLVGHLKI